ncbi:MAG: hypothetical protein HY870_00640 [Chloroflexi bacterium]|nr:hypothetical protein [Chloroflexota bacterium]
MLNNTLAAELVNGDPAEMWPDVTFGTTPLENNYVPLYFIKVKGRERNGAIYTFDTLIVTEWRITGKQGFIRKLEADDLANALTSKQLGIVAKWLIDRNTAAWARASNEVRDALGHSEPFLSVTEASRQASIPITTLDSAVRSMPQRVPAAQDERGLYRVRLSALKKALRVGRVRSREAMKAGRPKAK